MGQAAATRRWLMVIVALAAALRFYPIWFGLPYPQARPDEETAISKAMSALDGDPNPGFFHWPSLTFYVFAAVLQTVRGLQTLVGEARDLTFSEQALVTRAVVALAGTATILVLFGLARKAAGARVAPIASAFLAVAILHVRDSHFAMTDVLMTLLVWCSLRGLIDVLAAPPEAIVRTCGVAGLLAGLATSTKYSAAAVGASVVVVQILLFAREPRKALSWRGWRPLVAFGATMAAGFLVGTPHAVLDYATFSRDLAFDFEHLAEGHRGIELGRGWIYHATHSLPYGLGIPLYVAALAGIVPLVRYYRPQAGVLLAFGASYYYAIGSGYTVFFRYMLPLVPLLCLTAAVAVSWASDRLATGSSVRRAVGLASLLVLTAGPSFVQSMRLDLLLARTDTRVLASRWLTERIHPGDSLYDAGSAYTRLDIWHIPFARGEYEPSTRSFRGGNPPDWLVLQDSPLSAYASTPAGLRELAEAEYERVFTVRGTKEAGGSSIYDQQDAFFLPLSGLSSVDRPGPNIEIYRRRDLARAAR